ncbi:uncharacterized protein LOC123548901 [Mercenaria mercenaria]|uniref:uncharacterized protein LOC123548901 n=1 Tax=Mercenaria mercenaria TaxID=6596 RepID=UPI00234FA2F3|nr:uncharacterized protein LOC123548901 [Mercenaria mercenaria]
MSLPSFYQSLDTAFTKSSYLLLMIGSICSAVFKKENQYFFFDSHSHGLTGLSSENGTSILISFHQLKDLVTYMYALYDSMLIDITEQFDLLPVHFANVYCEPTMCLSEQNVESVNGTPGLNEWETVTNKRKKKSPSHHSTACEKETAPQKSNCDSCETLIGKYFKDQMQRSKVKQTKKQNLPSRTIYMRTYMQEKRQSDEFKNKDKEYTRKSMRNARQSEEYQKKDRQRSLHSKHNARQSEEYQKKDRQRTLKSMHNSRQSEEYQKKDRQRSLQSKRNARQSEEYQKKDRQCSLQSKRNARQSEEYQKKDRQRSLQSKRNARQSEEFREKEKENEKMSKRRARLVKEFKLWEAKQRREKRTSDGIKQRELEIQNKSKRKSRSNPYNLERERIAKQQWRLDARCKDAEKVMDSKRKVSKRKDPSFCEAECLQKKRRRCGQDIDTCIDRFQERISLGPVYICSCCHQTWFKHSVTEVKYLICKEKERYVTGVISVDNKEWFCRTCKSSINSGKVPKLSVLNGMKWPVKPKELELFALEERLIALRIPFMQLRELPRGRQLSIKGNVVNVPVDIQPVVNALPRPFDENVTVPVKLKKKMSFKSCAFSENVRPHKVLVALHWLMKNSDLYKNANVEIDENWIESVTANTNEILNEFLESPVKKLKNTSYEDFDSCMADLLEYTYDQDYSTLLRSCFQTLIKHASNFDVEDFENVSAEIHDHCTCEEKSRHQTLDITDNSEELYDSDAEEVAQENVGNIDTLLDDANLENRNMTFTFAPGEGQRPLSIFQDTDSEYLCFPSIFCGKRRLKNEARIVPVNYSDIAKWELRSQDRRAANCLPNIFFKLKKIQMKQLNDKANLAVRRCRTGTSNITAAQVMNSEYIDNIVRNDEGYYLFKQLRNSPSYLESRKKDVYAMLRQLGMPTWFMSLSSADTRWTDLLKMLATLNYKVNYSDEQIEGLSWEQKIKLIQSDPVTCSRYFDHRVQEFINTVLKSEHKPLGEIADYFYRVEFQQRGSPHIHMIVWVKNAPKYKVDSINDLTTYVDQYLTCSVSNPAVGSLVEIQTHKHSRTCRKREDRLCRFGYPLPPIPKTMILEPLETDRDKYHKLYQQLQKKMNDEKDGYSMSYEKFLTNVVQMSEEDYIKCIRSSLNSPKVFLKRHPSEIRVNLYNEHVLKGWRANVDIQFVLDPYACAMYIVSYISKSQRGMSNLLHAAAKEARNGNLDIKRQVRHIGNVFSNSVEVSAQEAVYLVLQMPLTKSTRDVVFINTSTSNERVQLLKPASVLENMPAESTDIMSDNVIKRYSKRPKVLQHYCLADYVSQFEVIYPDGNGDSDERNDDENNMEVTDDENLEEIETVIFLKSGIKIRRRQNSKVIRYVRFSRKTDEENHYREKLLLFHPWRNELTDLLPANFSTYKEHYESLKETVDQKCSYYEHHAEELEIARDLAEAEYDAFDEIAPGTQQVEAETAEEETVESETFIYFNLDRAVEHREYDIGIEIGCSVSAPQILSSENLLSDEDYRSLLQSLNIKQKQFYNHVIHWVKTKDAPLYTFLSGGAGVGKSVVIKALYHTLYRILNLKEGENPDDIRVLLCAYTGKAAFNINGSTISSAFKQKYKQANQTLTCDALNTFRSKYKNLSVVIIDEISMVSNGMLNFINQRLQELKGTRIPFGGVSVIVVGDLFQLKPVSGDWIFNDLTRDAEALSINCGKNTFHCMN